ncbi:MAG TPA: tetratricopeptide repeat protein [Longimicrobiales bacterium]|nr:tetratricopeptide repeat protein [Longimicrobiales bacterium]
MNRILVQRLSLAVAALVAVAGTVRPAPADAQQSRYRVLVANFEPQDGAKKNVGEDVAKELRKLIDDMPTHAAVSDRDIRDGLRKYDLKADDMACIQWRQLAVQLQWELVGCGSYSGSGPYQVQAHFQGAKSGEPFEVAQFSAPDAKAAAQRVFTDFESYVNQLRLALFCVQYLQSQQWDNALENCERAIAINPNSVTALYGRAEALMKKAEALVSVDNGEGMADSVATPDVDAIAASANAELPPEYTSLMEEALAGFDQVLEVNPIHESALTAAGYVAAKLGQPDAARAYYEQLIELDPTNVDIRLQLALDLARAGDPKGALMITEQGIEADPENVTLKEYAGHFALAAAQVMAAEADAEATATFSKALDYYRASFEAKGAEAEPTMLRNMLATLNQLQRYDEAVELGAQVTAVKREPGIWMVYAEALANAGNVERALVALDTVAAIDPSYPRLTARRGSWLLQRGQLAQAREAFQTAVERNEMSGDDVANTLFGYGYNQKCNGTPCEAGLEYFAMAREYATSERIQDMSHFFTGYILYRRGEQVQKPETAASARQALPIFQQSLEHLRAADKYTDQAAARTQMMAAAQQFIELQEALIKRGR